MAALMVFQVSMKCYTHAAISAFFFIMGLFLALALLIIETGEETIKEIIKAKG
jgi:hypothetical protein